VKCFLDLNVELFSSLQMAKSHLSSQNLQVVKKNQFLFKNYSGEAAFRLQNFQSLTFIEGSKLSFLVEKEINP